MKKVLLLGITLCLLLGSTACNTKKVNNTQNAIIEQNHTETNQETQEMMQKEDQKDQKDQQQTTTNQKEDRCQKIDFNQKNEIDVNNDGILESIEIFVAEERACYITIAINIDGEVTDIVEAEGCENAFLIQNKDGLTGILFDAAWSNDYCKTYLCQINENKEIITEEIKGHIAYDTVTARSFVLEDYLYLFGTWNATCEYEITSDLHLRAVADYQIKNDTERCITVKQNLLVSVQEDELWRDTEYKVGERFYPVATDCKEYMYFQTEEGEYIRIEFTIDEEY
ncbi:hypothetical protein, partial [Anaerosporobacter sp.]|uniref:hypothetical protein n=1 Tax=Anaerosporobacter sp. TaxID=1872529 RepID=UPI00286F782E